MGSGGIIFEDDPVWDGEQCEGECCSNGKSPPWFSVSFPNPTSDDIEVHICGDEGTHNEDTPIQLLEIIIATFSDLRKFRREFFITITNGY